MEREVTGGQEVLTPRIGAEQVRQAAEVLRKYRLGKQNLDRRIIDNEQFWKLRHWLYIFGRSRCDWMTLRKCSQNRVSDVGRMQ